LGAKLSDLGDIIAKALGSKAVLEVVGEVLVKSIPLRTRLGKAVLQEEGPTVPLPKLKDKTKYNRSIMKKRGELTGPGATPAKSGLNATGDLLTGLKFVATRNKLVVMLANREQELKAQNLLKIDPGYEFMNVSRPEMNRIIKAMAEKITDIIEKIKFDGF
jgi:hypothetical protein